MYILLAGVAPFDGAEDDDILKKVKAGKYSLEVKALTQVSKDGIDLLKKLLTYDFKKRISASEAL